MSKKFCMVYNGNHLLHRSGTTSPESPERIDRILNYLKKTKLIGRYGNIIEDFPAATKEQMLLVHDPKYLEFVKTYSEKGGGFLGDSTYFNKRTYIVACQAAGGAIRAVDAVVKQEYSLSFALVRPPGHHASADRYGGYCILNNGAIAARYLQKSWGMKKIMFIDWDAHAANGTMHIFYDDPSVLTLSIHRDPHEFYPHEGFNYQIGKGAGRGYTVNVEMPVGSSNDEYKYVFEKVVLPIYKQYRPDFIICCNGFDAYYKDPYASLYMTAEGYYDLAKMLRNSIGIGKMSILMEGGYNRDNGYLGQVLLSGFLGLDMKFEEETDPLSYYVTSEAKIKKVIENQISELRELLDDYFTF